MIEERGDGGIFMDGAEARMFRRFMAAGIRVARELAQGQGEELGELGQGALSIMKFLGITLIAGEDPGEAKPASGCLDLGSWGGS